MNCPSCGAEIESDHSLAQLVVCQYCSSAIVLDEKAAKVAGKMAVLAQTPGPLYVSGAGSFRGRRFRVIGRVRYGYSKGYWDEWYLEFDGGTTAWISEDENNFTLERCDEEAIAPVTWDMAQPGDMVPVGDASLHVDEKDVAVCEGGQGQLPFAVLSGEKIPFLELSSDKQFATFEYEEDGSARLFFGRRVSADDFQMDMTAEEAGVAAGAGLPDAEREAGDGMRERIVRKEDRFKDLKCYSCGAPLEVPDPSAESMSCQYCGSNLDLTLRRISCPGCGATVPVHGGDQAGSVVCAHCKSHLDISSDEPSVLGSLASKRRPVIPFKLGQECRFRGNTYHLAGHIRFTERDEGLFYHADELLLFSKTAGYLWLVMEDGHFSLSKELTKRPTGITPRFASQKQKFLFQGKQWTVFDSGYSEITWVSGELPWVAQVGDKTNYMDAISPPYLVNAEWTKEEMEWYRAEYITREEIARAFKMPVSKFPPAEGVAPNQPYLTTPLRKQSSLALGAFAALFLLLVLWSLIKLGGRSGMIDLPSSIYTEETLTDTFTITKPNSLCRAKFKSSISNNWVYLDLAIINENEEAVMDFSAQMSYYSGYEGGEHWSEGSKTDSVVFKIKDPGEYSFLVKGETASSSVHPNISIDVRQNVVLTRYFLIFFALTAFAAVVEILRKFNFEKKRWSPVIETDDD